MNFILLAPRQAGRQSCPISGVTSSVNIWTKFRFTGWKTVLDKPKDTWNYDTSGTPYDYDSIMHYTQTAFAKRDRNGRLLTTIKIKDKSVSCQLMVESNTVDQKCTEP